ncbi:MAG: methyltransferase domain-containing protein [Anaerolineae bacterium]
MDKLELPFDQYQRYKMVEELVELIRDGRRLRILDVGGHPGLMAGFLPEDDTFILDILPSDSGELSRTERLNYVQGDGARLPFEDDSFDLVVSIDTLEHIPSGQKLRFLEEQLRASRDYVLLAAPFEDENVSLAEQIVNEFFIKKLGHPNDSLEEHFENGLPRLIETLSFLDENRTQHLEIPNGYLYNWLVMMMALPAAQSLPDSEELVAMINRFYNRNLYVSDNRKPCYRTVILASKQHSLDRDFIVGRYEKAEAGAPDTKLKLADLLLSLKLEEPLVAVLEAELEKRTEWAFQLRDELEKRDRYINKLQSEFEERAEWAFKLREEIGERDQRVFGLQDELGKSRGELEERAKWALWLQEKVDEKGQWIVELQDELEGRTTWALKLKDDLEKRDEHLGKLQEEFEERTKWALQLRDEAQEKDQRILSLQDELEVQTQWALQLLEELEQKDQYLRKLQSEFEERTQWALQLDAELTRIKQSWYYRLFRKLEIRD